MYELSICHRSRGCDTKQKRDMECFRFGFDFPSLNRKAVILSSKVLGLPNPYARRTRRRGGRGRGRGRKYYTIPTQQPPPPAPTPVQLKVYKAPTFSIELENLFEVLDI